MFLPMSLRTSGCALMRDLARDRCGSGVTTCMNCGSPVLDISRHSDFFLEFSTGQGARQFQGSNFVGAIGTKIYAIFENQCKAVAEPGSAGLRVARRWSARLMEHDDPSTPRRRSC